MIVDLDAFYADVDGYLDVAESGRVVALLRDGEAVCLLKPASDME